MDPVTGPYTRTIEFHNPSWFGNPIRLHKRQVWYRQAPPFSKPLPFDSEFYEIDSVVDPGNPRNYSYAPSWRSSARDQAYNQAYSKFNEAVSADANWAVNLAEYRQSMSMILNRVGTLIKFTRALNRFDFATADKLLRGGRRGRHSSGNTRYGSRKMADYWLEYHFGWEPLVKDIGSSIELLQSNPHPKRVKGSATVKINEKIFDTDAGFWHRNQVTGRVSVKIQAKASVSNPNLFLANQMGFANPFVVAWELVPFSFVVDWFANVGDVLASMTDFMGISFEDLHVTDFQTASVVDQWYRPTYWVDSYYDGGGHLVPGYWHSGYVYSGFTGHSVLMKRTVGSLPRPSFVIKPYKDMSPVRGATAISLLLQLMKG